MSTQETTSPGLSGDPAALAAAGNTAWRAGDRAAATLAWERALLLYPRMKAADAGLAVAAHEGVRVPSPTACETYASAATADAWTALAACSFWVALLFLAAPRLLPVKRRDRYHVIAGLAIVTLLLSLPGIAGADSQSRRGVILKPDTPLLLTPTRTAEPLATLGAGDRVRLGEVRNNHRKVTAPDGTEGWLRTDAFAPLVPGA